MVKYIIRRLLWLIPILLGVITIVFIITALTPGDPVDQIVGINASEEVREATRESLGLNDPLIVRWANYIVGFVTRGDLGISYATGLPVAQELSGRLPVTIFLAFASVGLGVLLGIPLGVFSAIKQYTWVDSLILVLSMFAVSMPSFWLALLLMLLFSVNLGWLPPTGIADPLGWILPIAVIGFATMSGITRMTRSSMLEVMRQDYVRTAEAKGQREGVIVTRHMLRNALIPVLTSIGGNVGSQLGGAVTIEAVFAIPGIGNYIVAAINARNYTAIEGGILVLAVVFTLVNLAVDLAYVFVDPRLKSQLTAKKTKRGQLKKLLAAQGGGAHG